MNNLVIEKKKDILNKIKELFRDLHHMQPKNSNEICFCRNNCCLFITKKLNIKYVLQDNSIENVHLMNQQYYEIEEYDLSMKRLRNIYNKLLYLKLKLC